jgi:UDP-N-acetylmuramate dehydrogenase
MARARVLGAIRHAEVGNVAVDEPLAPHTSFNVGGPADLWIEPVDLAGLCETLRVLRENDSPVVVLGNGTNVLISDRGIRGAVLSLRRTFRSVVTTAQAVTAGAGVSLPRLSQYAARIGLAGLEWACGIPGSLGGSVVMNAGAHGGDVASCLESARIVTMEGMDGWISASALEFGYRHSGLQGQSQVVVAARLSLHSDAPDAIRRRLAAFRDRRRAAQPDTSLCAGSVFRNPDGGSAGRLLDQLGARGMRIGDAEVSEKHANFIVNRGSATAVDICRLIESLRQMAHDRAGVELRPEVLMMGDWQGESNN